jgi:hypothetical protein
METFFCPFSLLKSSAILIVFALVVTVFLFLGVGFLVKSTTSLSVLAAAVFLFLGVGFLVKSITSSFLSVLAAAVFLFALALVVGFLVKSTTSSFCSTTFFFPLVPVLLGFAASFSGSTQIYHSYVQKNVSKQP